MFHLIDGSTGLHGQFFESHPDQKRTADVIALNTGYTALTAFQARDLFAFAVQRLNLPAKATRLLRGLRRVLSGIVE